MVHARVLGRAALALALFQGVVLLGQQTGPQDGRTPRDTPAQPRQPTDSAAASAEQPAPETAPPFIARGRVLGADDQPLRRVRILVQSERVLEPAFTDDQGRFEMIVPASSGGLRLSKAGYLAQALNRRDAQNPSLTVRLIKGAAVNGTVTDSSGMPAVAAQVRLRRASDGGTGGRGGGGQQFGAETDDLGEFRVGGLPAGRYSVSVGRAGIDGAIVELFGGGRGGGDNIGRVIQELEASGQIDEAALRELFGRGRPGGPGGDGGRGAPPEARGRGPGAQPNTQPNTQANTQANNGQDGGRGRGGRGGRGQPDVNPNDLLVEVVAGQEATIALTYESPDAALAQLAPAVSQAQTLQAQRAGNQQQTGTATVRGRVFNHDGTPLKGATVQVSAVEGTGRRTAITDPTGRYEVTSMQAGNYRLRVSKTGLVPVEFGQSRAQQSGRVLSITPNLRMQGIDVTMPKGSTLSGIVADQWGEPIEGANVQVWQSRFVEGRPTLSSVSGVRSQRTDDRGRYRVYGLLPGNYFLMASASLDGRGGGGGGRGGGRGRGGPPEAPGLGTRVFYPGTTTVTNAVPIQAEVGQDTTGVNVSFSPGRAARVQGMVKSSTGQLTQGRAYLAVSQRSGAPLLPLQTAGIDDDGTFEFRDVLPGEYVVQVIEAGGGGNPGGQGGRGGGRGGDATVVGGQGGRGGDGGGQGRGGRGGGGGGGRGGAPNGQAAAAGGQVGAAQPGAPGGGGRGGGQAGATQPGAGNQNGGGRGGRGQTNAPARANAQAIISREFGMQFVTVNEGDTAVVSIDTAPGVRMAGRVVLEGDAGSTQPSSFGFTAYPADLDAAPLSGARTLRATVQEDGTFVMTDLVGALRFGSTRAPSGWWLKSVSVGGVNAALDPAEFSRTAPTIDGVTVVYANGTGAIEGRVLNERKQPPAEFNVIAFATEPDRWFNQSAYVKLGSAGQDGSFSVDGLPPAEYLITAVDRIDGTTDSGDWQNPAVLNALAPTAKRVIVGPGQRISTDLRLVTVTK